MARGKEAGRGDEGERRQPKLEPEKREYGNAREARCTGKKGPEKKAAHVFNAGIMRHDVCKKKESNTGAGKKQETDRALKQ